MTTEEFYALAKTALEKWPQGDLVKNAVGNLAVIMDGEYVAYLDLRTGEAHDLLDDEDD